MKVYQSTQKWLQRAAFLVGAALMLAVAPAFANPAMAAGGAQVIPVSGTFETSADQSLCTGIEDCVVDDLHGSFEGGTNRLITADFTETPATIRYHDLTRIDTNGFGVFEGDERGIIDVASEEFRSISVSTSVDGCGSKLILHINGTIDLDSPELEDSGTYEGVLVKKSC